jgi:hypothetical protein
MSIKQADKKSPFTKWVPLIGGVLALCFALIAYVLSDDLLNWAVDQFAGFDGNEMDPVVLRAGFGAFIFLILSAVGTLIVAAALPRGKKSKVREKDLAKERKQNLKAKEARQKRQREIARQNSQAAKRLDE